MATSQNTSAYNDTSDGETAPRSIEEALEMTLKSALSRGVQELKEVFENSFTEEIITAALARNDLNIEKTVLYLQELSDYAGDSPRSAVTQSSATEPEELESVETALFQREEEVVLAQEGITGIALDFSCSPAVERPQNVKVFVISDDVLRMILINLSGQEAVRMGRVCKSWSNVEKQSAALYKRECLVLWSAPLTRPEHIAFPFPFHTAEALWGEGFPQTFTHTKEYACSFKTWRNMFITRPRIYTNGVYISKTKYLRTGAVEGVWVNPTHEVVYYRYFRLYPDHSLVCLTSSERPSKVMPELGPDMAGVRVGEWASKEKELVAHAMDGTNVYSYHFTLTESVKGKHDLLRLKECSVRSSVNIAPLRMDTAGNSFPRFFRFFKL